jgi:glutathione S-transferase
LSDKAGVAEAHDNLRTAYGHLEAQIAGKTWVIGDAFTLADCAAAPALTYADCVTPIGPEHKNVSAYLDRLRTRPSFHRVLKEAKPHFEHFPIARKPKL